MNTAKPTRGSARPLPDYTPGEEMANSLSHGVGIAFGIFALILCVAAAGESGIAFGIPAAVLYGAALIALYATSSVYHVLPRNAGKRIMRVIDHCMIYFLIAGTYTPILVCSIMPLYPVVGGILFAVVWGCAALAVTFTAIDLKKYAVLSMVCYICMGWCILPVAGIAVEALTLPGFLWVLAGGIAYTIGAVLYGIGKKRRYMHSVFHVFVVLGSILQFVGILLYVL